MLQLIRDKSQGLIVGFIVFLISLTFALFGIQSYFTGQDDVTVAEVDSQKITLSALLERIKTIRQKTEEELGVQPSPEVWSSGFVKLQTLNLIIDEVVLDQVINDSGIIISDNLLINKLKDVDAFYDETGFSRERYESLLARTGTTTKEFEEDVASDILRSHIKLGVLGSEFSTTAENKIVFKIRNQSRDISLALVDVFSEREDIQLGAKELRDFYHKSKESFKTIEKVSLQFLKLSRDSIKNSLSELSELDLRDKYNSNLSSYTTPETRSIEYLLVPETAHLKNKARTELVKSIVKQASSGQNFSEIAETIDKAYELEIDAVDKLTRGDLTRALDDVVFSLKIGQVSEPVKTEFGTHIVKIKAITPSAILPFKKVKSLIIKEDLDNRIEQIYVENAELITELAFENPDSLQNVASTLELNLQQTELLSKDELVDQFGAAAISKIFNDDVLIKKFNSEPLEIFEESIIVFRLLEYKPPIIPSFEELESRVRQNLLREKLRQKTENFVKKIVTDLKESGGQSQNFRDAKLSWKINKNINRYNKTIPSNVIARSFETRLANNNPEYFYADYDKDTMAIVKVQNRQESSVSDGKEEELDTVRDLIVRPRSAVMWKDYLTILRQSKKIEIYESNFSP